VRSVQNISKATTWEVDEDMGLLFLSNEYKGMIAIDPTFEVKYTRIRSKRN
jgi:hypothetical protein